MVETLDASADLIAEDARIRPSLNTFLSYFMGKYAEDFAFENRSVFGETNGPYKRRIDFRRMTSEAIENLSEQDLSDALTARGVDVTHYVGKAALVSKALEM